MIASRFARQKVYKAQHAVLKILQQLTSHLRPASCIILYCFEQEMRAAFFAVSAGSLALLASGRQDCPVGMDSYVQVGEGGVAKREYDSKKGVRPKNQL